MEKYSISQVAAKYGLEPHTLRFYEKEGIIHPQRTAGGVRFYTREDTARLEMALCLKNTGMTLKDIRRYFQLVAQGDDTLEQRLKIFEAHLERVRQEISRMEENLVVISGKIDKTRQAIAAREAKN